MGFRGSGVQISASRPSFDRRRKAAISVSVPVSVSVPEFPPPPPSLTLGLPSTRLRRRGCKHPRCPNLALAPAAPAVVAHTLAGDSSSGLCCEGGCGHRCAMTASHRDQRVADGRPLRVLPRPPIAAPGEFRGPELLRRFAACSARPPASGRWSSASHPTSPTIAAGRGVRISASRPFFFRRREAAIPVSVTGQAVSPAPPNQRVGRWRPWDRRAPARHLGTFEGTRRGFDKRLETASRLVSRTAMRRVEDVDFRARIHRAESEMARCSEDGR